MALFNHPAGWLCRHRVLLSGVNVLARQASEVRTIADKRPHAPVSSCRVRVRLRVWGRLTQTRHRCGPRIAVRRARTTMVTSQISFGQLDTLGVSSLRSENEFHAAKPTFRAPRLLPQTPRQDSRQPP